MENHNYHSGGYNSNNMENHNYYNHNSSYNSNNLDNLTSNRVNKTTKYSQKSIKKIKNVRVSKSTTINGDIPMGKNFNYVNRYKCSDTIISYGLLPYHIKDNSETKINTLTIDNILILLHQRRDTFEYVDFVFQTWKTLEDLPPIFTNMDQDERNRVRNYTFFELWDDIWIDKTTKQYKDNYIRAKRRYDSIKHLIPQLLDTTNSSVIGPPWGFPKGRKNNMNENDVECAIRETEEETRINRLKFNVLYTSNLVNKSKKTQNRNFMSGIETKFSERFQGTNGMSYTTIYYLTEISDTEIPFDIKTPKCIRQTSFSEESTCIKWMTYNEACQHLNSRRQIMLKEAVQSIIALKNTANSNAII